MAEPWRIGPLGDLVTLPSPGVRAGVGATDQRVGSVSTSLDGTRTRDTLAVKRSWTMGWPVATAATRSLLRALARPTWGPLRLVDPHETNRLPVDTSAGGSESRSAAMFTPSVGTVAYADITDPPAGLPLRGAASWERADTSEGYLRVAYGQQAWRVALVTSQQVVLSAYLRGDGEASLGYEAWDAAGAAASGQTSAATLHATNWTRLQIPYTPTAGRVSLTGYVHVAAGQPAGTVETTAWQVELGSTAGDWRLGAGTPPVFAEITTDNYLPHDLFELAVTLWEM